MIYNRNKKGFTLVEILMVTAIFGILSVMITGIFINANNLQAQVSNYQKLQNDGRYMIEKIAKEIRAKNVVLLYPTGNPTSSISFWPDELDNRIRIYFDSASSVLMYEKNGLGAQLNSSDVEVVSAKFFIYPVQDPFNINSASATPDIQPRITILLDIANKSLPKYKKELILQTTISSRKYMR